VNTKYLLFTIVWHVNQHSCPIKERRSRSGRANLDELLTNIAVYWFSGDVASTLHMYQEKARQPFRFGSGGRIRPPLSYPRFPKGIINPTREWVERMFNVARWMEMPVGGHFAALEQPLALARDIHEAF
jgi:pimeloyl-ACP methyl ester carboxylesterase